MSVFCSSLISCFPGMLLMYCLSDFEMVSFAPVITVITFVSHSNALYFCCKVFMLQDLPSLWLYHISVS